MSDTDMRYDVLVENALRGVVSKVLETVGKEGLTGEQHFYITFRTADDGVEVPEYLRKRYPAEMTIVLQYQFYGLEITDHDFTVTLTFNNVPERLVIPFESITVFADPSVNFALQFQGLDQDDDEDEDPAGDSPTASSIRSIDETDNSDDDDDDGPDDGDKTGEVVSLDNFRKKR